MLKWLQAAQMVLALDEVAKAPGMGETRYFSVQDEMLDCLLGVRLDKVLAGEYICNRSRGRLP